MAVAFTEIEQRIIDILTDGRPHHRDELRDSIDSQCDRVNLRNHLSRMRKKLRPIGQDIICELVNRRICYRHVRLLASPYTD